MDAQSSVERAFFDVTVQFLADSVVAWPDDSLLPIALSEFKKLESSVALKLFQKHFADQITGLAKKDIAALYEAAREPNIAAINIEAKFSAANSSTQETMWTYISHMCRFASMQKLYEHIPSSILGAVTTAAQDLKGRIDSGDVDPSSVNPFELGKEVMAKFRPEELESMMKNIMGNPETMNSLMSQMSSALGGIDPSSLASGQAVDVSKLMNFMK